MFVCQHNVPLDLEREREERKDGELSVAAFKRQLASLREKCEAIDAEIEQYRAITANLRRGQLFLSPSFAPTYLTSLCRKIERTFDTQVTSRAGVSRSPSLRTKTVMYNRRHREEPTTRSFLQPR